MPAGEGPKGCWPWGRPVRAGCRAVTAAAAGADRACVNLGGHGDAGRREALSPGGLDRPQRFPLVCLRNSPGGISRQHGAQSQGVSAVCPHLGALVWKCRGGCWAGLHAPWVSRFPAAHHRSSNLLSPAGERRRQSRRPRCPVLVLQPRGLRAEPPAELKVGESQQLAHSERRV